MSIVIKTKDKEAAKKLMKDILEKYEEDVEGLYGPFDYVPISEPPRESLAQVLLGLDDHHRKTFDVVLELGEVTAEDVAGVTKRARAVESSYLNHLVQMGYLKKEKRGRKAYFLLSEKYRGL